MTAKPSPRIGDLGPPEEIVKEEAANIQTLTVKYREAEDAHREARMLETRAGNELREWGKKIATSRARLQQALDRLDVKT